MSYKIDEIIEFLSSDGSYHSLEEVVSETRFSLESCEKIAVFLAKYGFVKIKKLKIAISPHFRKLAINTDDNRLLKTKPITLPLTK